MEPTKKYRVAPASRFPGRGGKSPVWPITEFKVDKDGKILAQKDLDKAVNILQLKPGTVIELTQSQYHMLFLRESGALYPMWLLTPEPVAAGAPTGKPEDVKTEDAKPDPKKDKDWK